MTVNAHRAIIGPADRKVLQREDRELQKADTAAQRVHPENLQTADLQAADHQAENHQAENLQTADLQAENLQAENHQAADHQAENLQAETAAISKAVLKTAGQTGEVPVQVLHRGS